MNCQNLFNDISRLSATGSMMVSLVLFWSAFTKLLFRQSFLSTLFAIPYLSPSFIPIAVWLVPIFEIVVAIGLMLDITIAIWAAITLLSFFCILTAVVLRAKLKVPCSCFGPDGREFSRRTIIENLFLITLTIPRLYKPITMTEIPINLFTASITLIILLAAIKLYNNRVAIGHLRRLKAL